MPEPTSDHPFRNGDAGTEAKRSHLLRDRRDDLATMPHVIRRVFVSRVARIFATGSLALTGLFLLLMLKFPSLNESVAGLIPGTMPAPLPTALLAAWIIGGFFLLIGRSIAEFRFGVAMSKAVLPSDELYGDVDRLQNESPDNVARSMARRLDLLSRVTPVLAAACILPATAIAIYSMINTDIAMVNELEARLYSLQTPLLGIAAIGGIVAFVMAIRPTASLRALTLFSAVGTAITFAFGPHGSLFVLFAGLCMSAWVGMRSLAAHKRENIKIDQDGAPLPVVFNLRSACVQMRDSAKAKALGTKQFVGRHPRFFKGSAALVLFSGMAGLSYMAFTPSDETEALSIAETPDQIPHTAKFVPPIKALQVTNQHQNRLEGKASRVQNSDGPVIAFEFAEGAIVDASAIFEGATIPRGWSATVNVALISTDHPLMIDAKLGSAPRQLTTSSPYISFSYSNCGEGNRPLALTASPYGDENSKTTKATLQYEVQLEKIPYPGRSWPLLLNTDNTEGR